MDDRHTEPTPRAPARSRWAPNWSRWGHALSMVTPVAVISAGSVLLAPVVGRTFARNWAIPIAQGVTMGALLFKARQAFRERGEQARREQEARTEELRRRGHR